MKRVSPWYRFRLRWQDTPDGSGGVSSCGDIRIHDELIIEPGELRPEVVAAVLTHDLMRVAAVLNASTRLNRGAWRPVMHPARRKRVEALVNGWATRRYRKV